MDWFLNRIYYTHNAHPFTMGALLTGVQEAPFAVLELPWLANKVNVSCIPEGVYSWELVLDHPRFGNCFYLPEVPDRSEIMIHVGNQLEDTEGCLLVGDNFLSKSPPFLMRSRESLNKLAAYCTHHKITQGRIFIEHNSAG